MARVAGVDIPNDKRVVISLTYVYGVGLPTAKKILAENGIDENVRVSTNISEFDRVLGGGLVQGSLVLLAGDPGIGKSTLILQTSGELCEQNKKVLYVSAEESSSQLKLRAERLGVSSDRLYIYPQTNLEQIRLEIKDLKPDILVVDSIQSIYTNNISRLLVRTCQIVTIIPMSVLRTSNL